MTDRYVLYHANCPDGFGAALACWQRFRGEATYIPVKYNEPPPFIKLKMGVEIYIVDFSYSYDQFMYWASYPVDVYVFDHHETAEEVLADVKAKLYRRISVSFDMSQSGATLTWLYFNDTPMPMFFQYLRDRDLWLWKLPGSKEFSAALASYPKSFELWDSFTGAGEAERLIDEGGAILRYQNKMIDALCRDAELDEHQGYRILTVNTPLLSSEVGNKLCADHPDIDYAMCYSVQGDGRWRHELRSIGIFDVSTVAKRNGGGGHKNAAGFISDYRGSV